MANILLETGGSFLLEDGGHLLIEGSVPDTTPPPVYPNIFPIIIGTPLPVLEQILGERSGATVIIGSASSSPLSLVGSAPRWSPG